MNSKNYRLYNFEFGFKFEDELTVDQIENIYKVLINNDISSKYFTGVKNISNDDEESVAVLSSKDNELKVEITNYDVSFSYKNDKLLADFAIDSSTVSEIVNLLIESTGTEAPVHALRANRMIYSTTELDSSYLKAQVMNDAVVNDVEEYDIWLSLPTDDINGLNNKMSMNISNDHTTDIHRSFTKNKMQDQLDTFSSIVIANGVFGNISSDTLEKFLKFAQSNKITETALSKLGYGKSI